jgi:two-component system invasion response regulator UvrY
MPLSILIADDHQLVRKGLQMVVKEVLGFSVIVEFAENGREVIGKITGQEFDLLITDLNMPETNELALIPDILRIRPKLKILVVTMKPDKVFAARFLREGAFGYVNKTEPDEVLAEAIHAVSQGRRYISRSQNEIFSNALVGNVANTPSISSRNGSSRWRSCCSKAMARWKLPIPSRSAPPRPAASVAVFSTSWKSGTC